jgi:hypothetical protein
MYPLNWPLSHFVAMAGVPLSIRIEVFEDKESATYYATSPTVRGLNVESDSLDDLKREIEIVLPALLSINMGIELSEVKNKQTNVSYNTHLFA